MRGRKDTDVLDEFGGVFPIGDIDIFDDTPEEFEPFFDDGDHDIKGDVMLDATKYDEGLDKCYEPRGGDAVMGKQGVEAQT